VVPFEKVKVVREWERKRGRRGGEERMERDEN
jgi:hypothetical protein